MAALMRSLLIANRGEIAVRVARTAARIGISTVGVYSEPDRNALHVDWVDLAVALGGSSPAESYLRGDAIIQAAIDNSADAVHPGYGFLAENADFAQAVIDAGLIWVGPTPDQIRLLGDKVAAKSAAIAAGVPTTEIVELAPGSIPDGVPMPALVKAAAGGGGRGMRVVHTADELADAVDAAAREAEAAFGDGTVFVEPWIERGRHIEVQIIGDAHGNVVHLGERECSIQRRNQKVFEEAPSAGISDDTRTAILDGAIALARHVGYENAGTVEFLVGDDGTITFLEVNTRLQVEHPVTEAVTGLDLVELQLRVARGEVLPLTQDHLTIDGHAIEVRVVAEDPNAGWLPSTGPLDIVQWSDGVRVDAGFRSGDEVSAEYDSLIAKVISHGPDRTTAARVLERALRRSRVVGVRTNLDMAAAVLAEPDYLATATPTAYLDEHPDVLSASGPIGADLDALVLAATFALESANRADDRALGFAPSGWRNLRTQGQRRTWSANDTVHHVEYVRLGDRADVLLGDPPEANETGALVEDVRRSAAVRILASVAIDDPASDRAGPGVDRRQIDLEVDGVRHAIRVDLDQRTDATVAHAASFAGAMSFSLTPRFVDHDATSEDGGPICPLPGTVLAVHVATGDAVVEGQLLMVVEAMKMEHRITAGSAGMVEHVRFAEGDRVDAGDLLVELSDEEADTPTDA